MADIAYEYKLSKISPVSGENVHILVINEVKESPKDILKEKINNNVDFSLEYSKRYFSPLQKQLIKDLMYIGEKEYKINHQDILAIIFVESYWNPYVKGYNKNKSIDYGITQTNSFYMKERFNHRP